MADAERLITVLHRLADAGNTVLVWSTISM